MLHKAWKKTINSEKDEPIYGPWRLAWQRFRKNKVALGGLVMFSVITLLIIFVPILAGAAVTDIDMANTGAAPSMQHWLGTDRNGRDVFFRLFLGGRASLQVGIAAALTSIIIGTTIGGVSGYYGGKLDTLLQRFVELMQSIPYLPMMITVGALLQWAPADQKILVTSLLIGAMSWMGLSRLVRGQILSLREQEFMQATEALGLSDASKIFKHLVPNVTSIIIVHGTLAMAGAIIAEAALSFLGLGVVPPTPTWGNLMQLAVNSDNFRNLPWTWMPAGFLCLLMVLAINLMGEGLRDAFDPKNVK